MFIGVITSPEILYTLSVLWSYLTKVTPHHDIHVRLAVKYLLSYVWVHRHAKLTWFAGKVNPPFKAGEFHSFADSSWVDILPSRKSTNSYGIFYNNAVVSWKTKLSTIIATSSTES